METKIIDFLRDFGYLVLVVIIWPVTKFLAGRVIKSYESEIDAVRKELAAVKQEFNDMKSSYLPRIEAEQLVQSVHNEHERYFQENVRHHTQLREDFKHLNDRIDSLYELLSDKKH